MPFFLAMAPTSEPASGRRRGHDNASEPIAVQRGETDGGWDHGVKAPGNSYSACGAAGCWLVLSLNMLENDAQHCPVSK